MGPIIEPNPGPTLEIEVAAPEIDVTKSRPVNDNKFILSYKYLIPNEIIDEMNLLSIGFWSYFKTKTPLG